MVLLGVFSVASNTFYVVDFARVHGGYSFLWFCIMYVVAAYIRLYVPTRVKHQKWMFPIACVCTLFICGEKFLAYIITPRIFGSVMMEDLFYSYNSIFAVPCALTLFQGFRGLNINSGKFKKLIGVLAPLTFAAYLIHGHLSFRDILMKAVDVHRYAHSVAIFPYLIVCTLGIVLASCVIEWVRRWIFRIGGIDRLVARICDHIERKVTVWLAAVDQKS